MQDRELLKYYEPLVPFIAALCGESCEVLLHDVTNPDKSVVAIANGFHSNRKIGSPLTDLAKQIISDGTYRTCDYVARYKAYSGAKEFLSYTFFIKNQKNELVGMLCINRDTQVVKELDHVIAALKEQFNLFTDIEAESAYREVLDMPAADILHLQVKKAIDEESIPVKRMTQDERVALVLKMKEQGILNMKGAVKEISSQLDISEPTVYRYLNRK
ncbi:MAG: PAS domain-containing protein [Clostridia bacterium]|nr:PAS domain-containing protein [Clostridia bacterium]